MFAKETETAQTCSNFAITEPIKASRATNFDSKQPILVVKTLKLLNPKVETSGEMKKEGGSITLGPSKTILDLNPNCSRKCSKEARWLLKDTLLIGTKGKLPLEPKKPKRREPEPEPKQWPLEESSSVTTWAHNLLPKEAG
ncbi:hypothetical protein G9A89_007445 [Geosiphon pyriformis]|nr:hypothetical protein G9A89_007445 [Geosiphon pyriformis]